MTTARLIEQAKGIYVISATPFTEEGALDLAGAQQLVDFYLGCGVSGMNILGVLGEANRMSESEAISFARVVLRHVDGRVPIVVGVTSSALTNVESLTRTVVDLGAAGVMLQPLAGLKGGDAVYAYVDAVLATIGPDVPVCFQDFPQLSGVYLSVPVWNRMVDVFPQLVMLRHEDAPGLAKLSRIRAGEALDGRRRIAILVGNNGLYFPQELQRGVDGAMTGFAYPDVLVEVYNRFVDGDVDSAEDLFDLYLPINRHEQQPGFGLAVRKEILRRRGAMPSATTRYPAYKLSAYDHAELDRLMTRIERKAPAPASP